MFPIKRSLFSWNIPLYRVALHISQFVLKITVVWSICNSDLSLFLKVDLYKLIFNFHKIIVSEEGFWEREFLFQGFLKRFRCEREEPRRAWRDFPWKLWSIYKETRFGEFVVGLESSDMAAQCALIEMLWCLCWVPQDGVREVVKEVIMPPPDPETLMLIGVKMLVGVKPIIRVLNGILRNIQVDQFNPIPLRLLWFR